VTICFHGNVFTVPLLSNGCPFLFHYSSFQLSCHNIYHVLNQCNGMLRYNITKKFVLNVREVHNYQLIHL
jgi:hypothetical protein